MKTNAETNGIIYKSMQKHRRRFLIIEILLAVFLIWYFVMCQEYIINVFQGAVDFDEARFASEVATLEVGEPFELHRNDDISINDYAIRADSYWQDDKYEFNVSLKNVQKLDVDFNNETTGTDGRGDEISSNMYVADIGGIKTLVLTYPHTHLASEDAICGIFTSIPLIAAHDVAKSKMFNPTDEICAYMLDTRGLEMESESFDLLFTSVLLIVVIYLGIKLWRQYRDYLRTPTYRQLTKYGDAKDIAYKIETELADGVKEKKRLVCENWIVSEDTFKLKIVKNHMKHGNFRYTPENY